MPRFSPQSQHRLDQCDFRIQIVFNHVIKYRDCKLTEGHRDKEAQNKYFKDGKSKLRWPNGKHNKKPSTALDAYPYPVQLPTSFDSKATKDKKIARFYHFAGYVLAVAEFYGFEFRWGGDWDGDGDFSDQSFDDLVHFEIRSNSL